MINIKQTRWLDSSEVARRNMLHDVLFFSMSPTSQVGTSVTQFSQRRLDQFLHCCLDFLSVDLHPLNRRCATAMIAQFCRRAPCQACDIIKKHTQALTCFDTSCQQQPKECSSHLKLLTVAKFTPWWNTLNFLQFVSRKKQWGLCAFRHGIQISMEAILACHPARSTE